MLTLQMHPDRHTHALLSSSPVCGPESRTVSTAGPAVGAMPSLSIAALPPSHHADARPPPAKRPKLSLNTSTAPLTCCRSTTALRSAAMTDSPTRRNTYVNAYEPYRRPSASSPSTPPPRSQPARIPSGSPIRPLTSPYGYEAPYRIPLGIRGILRNGPLSRRHFSARSARTPRRLFSAIKRVSYRSPLEEVVLPRRTLSDIEEVSEEEIPSPTAGDVKAVSCEGISETGSHGGSEDHVGCSEITARGCKKRRREWVWTLEDSPEPARRNYSR